MPGASRTSGGDAIDPKLSLTHEFCCDAQRCPLVDFVRHRTGRYRPFLGMRRIMTTRRSITSLATTAAAALALTSAASAFPDKLLQFVTPYPFGGSHVLHASIITTAAEPHFGQ